MWIAEIINKKLNKLFTGRGLTKYQALAGRSEVFESTSERRIYNKGWALQQLKHKQIEKMLVTIGFKNLKQNCLSKYFTTYAWPRIAIISLIIGWLIGRV